MNKQTRDFVEFLLTLLFVGVIAVIGAIISGLPGMFWFSLAAIVVAFVFLFQRQSFYKWIYVFLFVLLLLDKFIGLVNIA